MRALSTLTLLSVFLAVSCNDNGNDLPQSPVSGPPAPPPAADSAQFEFRLDGLKDTYTLDDTIRAVLIAINKASPRPLCFHAGGIPPEYWFLRRPGHSEIEYFYPIIIGPMQYNDSLKLGDTLTFPITWAEQAFVPSARYSFICQKAFAGSYELCAHFPTSDLFGDITFTGHIVLEEQGEGVSCILARMSHDFDSLDYGLAIRNRLLRQVQYAIEDSLPVRVSFSSEGDTVLKRSYPLPFSTMSFGPYSDNMPYRFRRANTDTLFAGMWGTYTMSVSLIARDDTFRASYEVKIFPRHSKHYPALGNAD